MSALAKIFVVFNFVLSVFFFGSSAVLYLTRTDWRESYTKLRDDSEEQVQSLRDRFDRIKSASDATSGELSQCRSALNNATADLSSANERLATAQKDAKVLTSRMEQAAIFQAGHDEILKSHVEKNSALSARLEEANSRRDEALGNLDTALAERNSMKLDLESAQQELHQTKVAMTQLSGKFDEIELKYNYVQARCPGAAPDVIAPAIDAQVVAVDNGEKLVVLSVGRDQKVEKGHRFTVYRGESFVGKVEVFEVYPDLAGARILFTKEGATVRQGDKASTALN